MLHRQSVWFLGKYVRWQNFRHRFLALKRAKRHPMAPQTGLSGAFLTA